MSSNFLLPTNLCCHILTEQQDRVEFALVKRHQENSVHARFLPNVTRKNIKDNTQNHKIGEPAMVQSDLNRAGTVLAGVILMLLALFIMVPLDGEWSPFPFSPYLELIIGIPLFALGLWIAVDSLKKPTRSTAEFPIVDEWIGEQGKEQLEISRVSQTLGHGEKSLAILAGRADFQRDRLAVTDRRVIVYQQENPANSISISRKDIVAARCWKEPVLAHLGEIELSTKNMTVVFGKVGFDYAQKAVELINGPRWKGT